MSGNRWEHPDVPHKGWRCVDVVDLRADGESADETDYATCQMCGNEKIRYVHIMEHPDLDENFEVGCVCGLAVHGVIAVHGVRSSKIAFFNIFSLNATMLDLTLSVCVDLTLSVTLSVCTIRPFKISPEGHHEHPEYFQDRTH